MQRYARWTPRMKKLSTAGYLVITWPPSMREALKSRTALGAARAAVRDVLRSAGYDRGLTRWHWTGDEHADTWHPHLNVVIEAGRLKRAKLAALKSAIRKALGLPENGVIHYKFRDTPAKMMHLARYITKPHWGTAGLDWNPGLAVELAGFHNDGWWGKWDGPDVWGTEGRAVVALLEALAARRCPACGGNIAWNLGMGALAKDGAEEWAAGYWYTARDAP